VLALPDEMLLLALGATESVDVAIDDALVFGWAVAGRSRRLRYASLYRGATRPHSLDVASAFVSPGAIAPCGREAQPAPERTRSGVYMRTFRRTESTRVVRAPLRACGVPGSTCCPPRRVAEPGVCDGSVAG
jgi:hypothetical protein